jgi:adenine/guanine phosphoribosyltransferase-like PRPP-binding protein
MRLFLSAAALAAGLFSAAPVAAQSGPPCAPAREAFAALLADGWTTAADGLVGKGAAKLLVMVKGNRFLLVQDVAAAGSRLLCVLGGGTDWRVHAAPVGGES